MPYRAPVADLGFVLRHVAGYGQVAATDRFAHASWETAQAVLDEAGKLAEGVLAPLNRTGDRNPARLEGGVVHTASGFAEGYRALASGGWVGMAADPAFGGMGLPQAIATAVHEMFAGACLSLQLNPLLTQGQIEALEHHADDALKALYLPKLASGEWSGTMNLTEPQAGTDLGALVTRAEPRADGTYAVTGQKIYITWGDADFLPNVCHLVLARLPDAPEGSAGISLFLVPKFLPDGEGRPATRNGVSVIGLEHKLGIHASPTCVMQFDRATGWLVGEANRGLAAMFTMMNNARLGVGAQGVGVAEAALQQALDYAQVRRQGRTPVAGAGMIVDHADVRRMLATMRAQVFSARAIALSCAVAIDMARATGSADWAARAALLTPIAKACGTETGHAVAHEAIQVHGGMGFIEETGIAQYARDVRITAIYEGTNGIQAMDLVGRKLSDAGEAAFRLIDEVQAGAEAARATHPDLAGDVWQAAEALREATEAMVRAQMNDRFGGALPYLRAFALVLGGHFHLKAALAAGNGPRLALAQVAIRRLMPMHAAHLAEAREGAGGLYDLSPDDLAA